MKSKRVGWARGAFVGGRHAESMWFSQGQVRQGRPPHRGKLESPWCHVEKGREKIRARMKRGNPSR